MVSIFFSPPKSSDSFENQQYHCHSATQLSSVMSRQNSTQQCHDKAELNSAVSWHGRTQLKQGHDTAELNSAVKIDTAELKSAVSWHDRTQLSSVRHSGAQLSSVMTRQNSTQQCHDTAELNSAVSWHDRAQLSRSTDTARVWFCGVNDTTELNSAVSMTPLNLILWCQWSNRVRML